MIYKIPVSWTMAGFVYVNALDLEQAMDAALDANLPKNGEYLEDSFAIDDGIQTYQNKDEIEEEDDDVEIINS